MGEIIFSLRPNDLYLRSQTLALMLRRVGTIGNN